MIVLVNASFYLYKLVLELNRQESRDFRIYIENSYIAAQQRLAQLEDSLRVFQISSKLIEFDTQTKISFETIGKMETQKQEYKLQIDYLKNYGTRDNVLLQELNLKYDIIQKNIDKLIMEGENYLLSLDKLPDKGLAYFRLYRDIRIQQQIVEILLPMLEKARMEEQKKTANLQLLDAPYIPQYKAKPKRLKYMIILTFMLFVFEMMYYAIKETYLANKTEIKTWLNK